MLSEVVAASSLGCMSGIAIHVFHDFLQGKKRKVEARTNQEAKCKAQMENQLPLGLDPAAVVVGKPTDVVVHKPAAVVVRKPAAVVVRNTRSHRGGNEEQSCMSGQPRSQTQCGDASNQLNAKLFNASDHGSQIQREDAENQLHPESLNAYDFLEDQNFLRTKSVSNLPDVGIAANSHSLNNGTPGSRTAEIKSSAVLSSVPAPKCRRVQFRCRCEDAWFGTHVRAVGSCRALGSWTPEFALLLQTSPEDFPIWSSDVRNLEIEDDDGGSIEYKYVICNENGQAERWEDRSNRMLLPPVLESSYTSRGDATVVVSESFNAYDLTYQENYSDVGLHDDIRKKSNGIPASHLFDISSIHEDRESDWFSPTLRSGSSAEKKQEHVAVPEANPQEEHHLSAVPHIAMAQPAVPQPTAGNPEGGMVREESISQLLRKESLSHLSTCSTSAGNPEGGMVREESRSQLLRKESLSHLSLKKFNCEAAEFEQRYRLEGRAPLAEGSFGVVWVCSDRSCSEKLLRAVKIVHKSRLKPRECQLLLGKDGEIQTHLRLKHEHIIALHQAFDDLQTVSLVMEYARGGDLFDAVTANRRARGLGIREVDASVAQRHILLALAYLDSQHIVHRDVKCENVLLLHQGVPIPKNVMKLCDFGFATMVVGNHLTDKLGSPDTVAPEVILGHPYGTKADVWSAGVILFMMLSGRSPFWAPTDVEVLRRVSVAEWSMAGNAWNDVSEPAKACVRLMMTTDPSQRPTAKETLEFHGWLTKPLGVPAG